MNYQQLIINTNKENANFIEEVLLGLNALSIDFSDTFDNPILEPNVGETPLWDNITLKTLFNENIDKDFILSSLNEICNTSGKFEFIENKNWQKECNKNFIKTSYGKNPKQYLWICPSWESCDNLNGNVIKMDPGMAFGTGSHQTTSLCLEYLANNPPINKTVLDFGCGSGILAIASKKLGANIVEAIDNDPQAILSSRNNAKHNNTDLNIIYSDDFKIKKFDIVIANILTNTLIELFDILNNCVKVGGKIIMSGIMTKQKDDILQIYNKYFIDFIIKQKNDWLLITATKK